jgi:hypothetical protein
MQKEAAHEKEDEEDGNEEDGSEEEDPQVQHVRQIWAQPKDVRALR